VIGIFLSLLVRPGSSQVAGLSDVLFIGVELVLLGAGVTGDGLGEERGDN
jgi:hypothetical protein